MKLSADEIVAQALVQIRKTVAAQQQQEKEVKPTKAFIAVDPDRDAKIADLKAFVQRTLTVSSFQPFARNPAKQFRFDAFSILKKARRVEEFQLLQPHSMTEWERQRENVKNVFFFLLF